MTDANPLTGVPENEEEENVHCVSEEEEGAELEAFQA